MPSETIKLPEGLSAEDAAHAVDKIAFGDFDGDLDLVIYLYNFFRRHDAPDERDGVLPDRLYEAKRTEELRRAGHVIPSPELSPAQLENVCNKLAEIVKRSEDRMAGRS